MMKIQFLTLKIGGDLYTSVTYTQVNTVKDCAIFHADFKHAIESKFSLRNVIPFL